MRGFFCNEKWKRAIDKIDRPPACGYGIAVVVADESVRGRQSRGQNSCVDSATDCKMRRDLDIYPLKTRNVTHWHLFEIFLDS